MCPTMTPKAVTPRTMPAELLTEQAKEAFFHQGAGKVEIPDPYYLYERHVFLVCTASLHGAVQTEIPKLSLTTPPLLSELCRLAGPPGERCMCSNMIRELYGPRIANNVYKTAGDSSGGAITRLGFKRKRHLKIFRPEGPWNHSSSKLWARCQNQ